MSNLDKILDPRIEFYDEERERERGKDSGDSEASDEETMQLQAPQYERTQADILSERTSGKLTGPKGVIADYRYAKRQITTIPKLTETSNVPSLRTPNLGNENTSLDEFEDFSDDEFFKAYRQKRLQELSSRGNSSKKTFGEVFQLNFDTYNNAIDSANEDTPVIIHLYETHLPECQKIHSVLKDLALTYGYAKFCEIPASATGSQFDDEVLPTILVYKCSKLIANLVRFIDELSTPSISAETVESVLLRHNALSTSERKLISQN